MNLEKIKFGHKRELTLVKSKTILIISLKNDEDK